MQISLHIDVFRGYMVIEYRWYINKGWIHNRCPCNGFENSNCSESYWIIMYILAEKLAKGAGGDNHFTTWGIVSLTLMTSQFKDIVNLTQNYVSKTRILRCMGSKFCVKFQRYPLKFYAKFWSHTPQNMHFRMLSTFELWHLIAMMS